MFKHSTFQNQCDNDLTLFFNKVIFLTLLAAPKRISEFQALSLSKSTFSEETITLRPHLKFDPKNATATFSPKDVKVPRNPDDKHLCPVFNLNKYLQITSKLCQENNGTRPDQLFIKENTLPFTTHQLRASVRDIISRGDSLAPKEASTFHSFRKVTSTLLDHRGFTLSDILESMQWRSSQTYLRYYCQLDSVQPVSQSCIIAGNHIPST